MSSGESASQPISDSQSSSISNFSGFDLSQGTMNQVLNAVGLSGAEGDRFIEEFQSELNEDEEGDPVTGFSSVSVSRTVIHAKNFVPELTLSQNPTLSEINNSTLLATPSSQPPLPTLTPLTHHGRSTPLHTTSSTPSPTTPQINTSTHFGHHNNMSPLGCDVESPLLAADSILTPPSTVSQVPIPICQVSIPSTYSLQSKYPPNLPFSSEYKFQFITVIDKNKSPYSKNAHYTYSDKMERLYLKQGVVLPLHYSVTRFPPLGSVVRVMAIHKAPEMISESLICCPKHIDLQRKDGVLFPLHFVRCQNEGVMYHEHPITTRLSVCVPFSALQKTLNPHSPPESGSLYAGLYLFPCFTSELQRGGQLVQLIFTLECGVEVLGRCVIDVRVCASPGRDREVDEKRVSGQRAGDEGATSSANHTSGDSPAPKRGRKRAASSCNQADVIQCTLPPKQLCVGLSGTRVQHTITTYPELIPFIEICVQMMERVHSEPVSVANGNANEQGQPNNEEEVGVSEWLEEQGLARYKDMLKRQGVEQLFQVLAVSDQELKKWGMSNSAHRKKFVDGQSRIKTVKQDSHDQPGTPPLFSSQSPPPSHPPPPSQPSQPSQLSQGSQLSSTQPFGQTFEVLQIQLRKNISNSSQ